jgi:hypothetical protein
VSTVASPIPPVLYQGMVAPQGLRMTIAPSGQSDDDVDLSTTSAAELRVGKPSGRRVVWGARIVGSPEVTGVVVEHPLASGDLDEVGEYVVFAVLTVTGGEVETEPRVVKVKDPYAIRGTT